MARAGLSQKSGKGARKDTTKSIDALFGAAMLREVGVQRVLKALKDYRVACTTGRVTVNPTCAFVPNKVGWLYAKVEP